ncbi:MAG TPA: Gfo/Idh/MocA family oxidoreductase [Spirochaetota bacterium]
MVRSALIGCGRIGAILEDDPLRNKPCTHFGGMRSAGIIVTSACDIRLDRLRSFSQRASIADARCFTDYHELLSHPTNIVTIASHTDTHAEITIAAARSGCKVIVCEKPVAANIHDARKMLDACRAHNVTLIINHERRYDPRYRAAKKLIDRGAIGKIISIRGILPTHGFQGTSYESSGGGPLLHDGTHLVDIISYFAGRIVHVDGRFKRNSRTTGYEDHAWALLETETGIPAHIAVGGGMHYFGFGVEVFGSEGKIEIGNGYNRLYRAKKSRFYKGFFDLSEVRFPSVKGNCFTELYREAKKIVHDDKLLPSSSGEDGLAALETVHAVYLSAHKRREVTIPSGKDINIKKIFALTD